MQKYELRVPNKTSLYRLDAEEWIAKMPNGDLRPLCGDIGHVCDLLSYYKNRGLFGYDRTRA